MTITAEKPSGQGERQGLDPSCYSFLGGSKGGKFDSNWFSRSWKKQQFAKDGPNGRCLFQIYLQSLVYVLGMTGPKVEEEKSRIMNRRQLETSVDHHNDILLQLAPHSNQDSFPEDLYWVILLHPGIPVVSPSAA